METSFTEGKIVVFAELSWSPGDLEQCEDRIHRIGQKEMVQILYLVAKETMDEHMSSVSM